MATYWFKVDYDPLVIIYEDGTPEPFVDTSNIVFLGDPSFSLPQPYGGTAVYANDRHGRFGSLNGKSTFLTYYETYEIIDTYIDPAYLDFHPSDIGDEIIGPPVTTVLPKMFENDPIEDRTYTEPDYVWAQIVIGQDRFSHESDVVDFNLIAEDRITWFPFVGSPYDSAIGDDKVILPSEANAVDIEIAPDADWGSQIYYQYFFTDEPNFALVQIPEDSGTNWLNFDDPAQGFDFSIPFKGFTGDDTIDGSNVVSTPLFIDGEFGNDTIIGGGGADTIDGGSGDDLVYGGAGDDIIDGGSGSDIIYSGEGDDFIGGSTGTGDDTLYGEGGADTIEGGFGDDTIDGGEGDDFIDGGPGDDTIFGGSGENTLIGGSGKDGIIYSASSTVAEIDFYSYYSAISETGPYFLETRGQTSEGPIADKADHTIEDWFLGERPGDVYATREQWIEGAAIRSTADATSTLATAWELADPSLKTNSKLVTPGNIGYALQGVAAVYQVSTAEDEAREAFAQTLGLTAGIGISEALLATLAVSELPATGAVALTVAIAAAVSDMTSEVTKASREFWDAEVPKSNAEFIARFGSDYGVTSVPQFFLSGAITIWSNALEKVQEKNEQREKAFWNSLGLPENQYPGSIFDDIYDTNPLFEVQPEPVPIFEFAPSEDVLNLEESTAPDSGLFFLNDLSNILNSANTSSTVFGLAGNDVITTGSGDDWVSGGDGDDQLFAGSGNDSLFGGPGNDTLHGQEGDDSLFSGPGDDLSTLNGGAGNDFLDGGEGEDAAEYIGISTDFTITLNADGTTTITDNNVTDGLNEGTDTLISVEFARFLGDDITIDLVSSNDPDPNVPPTADDDSAVTDEDTATVIDVLDGDNDSDGTIAGITEIDGQTAVVGIPIALTSGATATLNADGTISYDPNGQFEALNAGDTDSDGFSYTIQDDDGAEAVGNVSVTINGVTDLVPNVPPTADNDSATTDEDTATVIDVLNGDTDSDGTITGITKIDGQIAAVGTPAVLASGATATLNADGTITYDPNGQFEALNTGESDSDGFSYTIEDDDQTEAVGNVTVTIDGVTDVIPNVPPTADNDSAVTDEDTATVIDVLDGDSDSDGTIAGITQIDGQTAVINSPVALNSGATATLNADGTITYDPNDQFEALNTGETGSDGFNYTIQDDDGDEAVGNVTVTISGVTDMIPNLSPMADDDTATTDEDTATVIDVLDGDSDSDGTIVGITQINGQAVVVGTPVVLGSGATAMLNADGTIAYDPDGQFEALNTGETGSDGFSYTIEDDDGDEAVGNVTVTINGVTDLIPNVPPTADDDSATTDEDTATVIDVLDGDSDSDGIIAGITQIDGQGAVVGIPIVLGSGATATLNPDGTIAYDPNDQFEALNAGDADSDAFTYTIEDDDGAEAVGSVAVTINGVTDVVPNTPPTADVVVSSTEVEPGDSVTFDGTGSSDLEGDIASYAWDFDGDGQTDATTATANFTYNTDGTYEAKLTVTDEDGETDVATQTIVVSTPSSGGGNDDPTNPANLTFLLVNATTDTVIGAIESGATIDLADFGGQALSFFAVPEDPSAVESVRFFFDGDRGKKENVEPYALFGDRTRDGQIDVGEGDLITVGSHQLKALGYSENGTRGDLVAEATLDFSVIDSGDSDSSAGSGDDPGDIGDDPSGGGDDPGDTGDDSSGSTGLTFLLVNATTDSIVGPIESGATIDLADYGGGSLSFFAVPEDPSTTESVRFSFNGQRVKKENVEPYALFGDSTKSGDIGEGDLVTVGDHQLKAVAFASNRAQGDPVAEATLDFTVIDTSDGTGIAAAASLQSESLEVEDLLASEPLDLDFESLETEGQGEVNEGESSETGEAVSPSGEEEVSQPLEVAEIPVVPPVPELPEAPPVVEVF